jgi:hypothetical protein
MSLLYITHPELDAGQKNAGEVQGDLRHERRTTYAEAAL